MSFSRRRGLKPAQKAFQLDDIDQELRNSLWNALDLCYWRNYSPRDFHESVRKF